ncbi:MAG: O-antigen ligase family protein [Clostridium sp.]|nr:O-antigen ligase family protein [Clostridium sp.]
MDISNKNYLTKLVLLIVLIFPFVANDKLYLLGIVLIIFYLLYLYVDVDARKKLKRTRAYFNYKLNTITILFFIYMSITFIFSLDRQKSLISILTFTTGIIIFFIVQYEFNKANSINLILKSYFAGALILSLYHVAKLLYIEISLGKKFDYLSNISFLTSGSLLAYFLIVPFFPALVMYIFKEKAFDTKFYLAVSVFSLITIFTTKSPGAIVGIFIGLTILSLLYSVKFIVALIPTSIFLFLIPVFTRRQNTYFMISENFGRRGYMIEFLSLYKKRLFFGTGINTVDSLYFDFLQTKNVTYDLSLINKPFNLPFKILVEGGIFGAVLFIILFVILVKSIIKYTKSYKVEIKYKAMYVGFLISLIVIIALNFLDSFAFEPKLVISFFIVMGIMFASSSSKGIKNI